MNVNNNNKNSSSSTTKKKLRILCLHGGYSNNEITVFQTTGLKLYKIADCDYLHAPHFVGSPYPGLELFSEGPWYTWTTISELNDKNSTKKWKESIEYALNYIETNGPYDGIYGFSLGVAMITQLLLSLPKKSTLPKFVILACGGGGQSIITTTNSTTRMVVPSFHIIGKKDSHRSNGELLRTKFWTNNNNSNTTDDSDSQNNDNNDDDDNTKYDNHDPNSIVYRHEGGHAIESLIEHREPKLIEYLHKFIISNTSSKEEEKKEESDDYGFFY